MREIRYDDFEALTELTREDFGPWGPWRTVTQEMINQFADLTGDRQWIHVDVERAQRESPYGGTVAHGLLTLSLLPSLKPVGNWRIVGHGSATNYGAKGLKFISPVTAGSSLRARSRLAEVERHPKGTLLTLDLAVHKGTCDRPALLYHAQVLYRSSPSP